MDWGRGCLIAMGSGSAGLGVGLALPSGALLLAGWAAWDAAGDLTGEVSDMIHLLAMGIGLALGVLGGGGLLAAVGLVGIGALVGLLGGIVEPQEPPEPGGWGSR